MVSPENIDKLAELARIAIKEEEKASLAKDIDSILAYVSELQNVEIKKGKKDMPELVNVMREDINSHEAGIYTKDLLEAAPSKRGEYFSVKKIL